jgi:hypothetical protein
MNKGMISALMASLFSLVLLLSIFPVTAEGEIYKVVNPDGSVTYTDQRPSAGAQPVELKPLSVIDTDIQVPEATAEEEPKEPTARDLRRQFQDFRITQPQNEETFWGAQNTVVISWGASQPVPENMKVALYVDGQRREAPASGSVSLAFERGEHQAYAELRDARNRKIVVTPTVTFFVKQHSANFNRPVPTPRN